MLVITIGVPGSGKTSYCREQAEKDGGILVGRDHIRHMAFGKFHGLTTAEENEVTKIQHGMIISALARGTTCWVDDTNLNKSSIRQFAAIAMEQGAQFEVKVMDTPLDECIARDKVRDRTVGEKVIRKMANRHLSAVAASRSIKEEFKLPGWNWEKSLAMAPAKKREAVLVDVDGTLARIEDNSRSHYETGEKLLTDKVNRHVRMIVGALESEFDYSVVILSGRDEGARRFTVQWLKENGIQHDELLMRKAGDQRRDSIIKAEIYRDQIEPYYDVLCAIDDRPRVLRTWKQLGIPTVSVGSTDIEF